MEKQKICETKVMDNKLNETCEIRDFDQGLIKNEGEGSIIKIEVENKTEMDTDREFISKHKNDWSNGIMSGILLNRIKYEHNDVDCDEGYVDKQKVLEVGEINEELMIKNEIDENTDAIPRIVLNSCSRIKNEDSEANWNKCDVHEMGALEMKIENELSVMYTDCKTFEIRELSDENNPRNNQNTETISKILSNRITIEHSYANWNESDLNNKNWMKVENEQAINMDSAEQELTQELIIKDESDENTYSVMVLRRMKNEHDRVDHLDKCDAEEKEALEFQLANTNQEIDADNEKFKITQITEELLIKNESDASMDSIPERNLDRIAKRSILKKRLLVSETSGRKSFSCYNCNYTAHSKCHLIRHLRMHDNQKKIHRSRTNSFFLATCGQSHATFRSRTALDNHMNNSTYKSTIIGDCDKYYLLQSITTPSSKHRRWRCIHCNATFKSKMSLDDHVVQKHPDFITSISSKLHECTKCIYKTVVKGHFNRHMLRHSGISSSYKLSNCIHCNATFKCKSSLNNHVAQKHPDFITSISSKLYECSKCIYKTVTKRNFDRHMLKHPGTASSFKLSECIHCNATFKSKVSLDNHIVKQHPDFITSISSKIYECTECIYKTVIKGHFDRHMLQHSQIASSYNRSKCSHCNATFKCKFLLDDHVVKKHPDFITSISSKLHECTKCDYKTVNRIHFNRHMITHPGTASSYKLSNCKYCNATFKCKISLDDHVVKKHPDFITSVSSKLHECTKCIYKTVHKTSFNRHMSQHSGIASRHKPSKFIH